MQSIGWKTQPAKSRSSYKMIASTQTNAPLSGSGKSEGRPSSKIEQATSRLKSSGLRVTHPRVAILAALCETETPTSIEKLHAMVGTGECDLVTIYRCMAAFEKIGLVHRAFFHNGTALFKLSLGQSESYHVVCKSSNQVTELDAATSEELQRAIEAVQVKLRARGYQEVGHIVEFFGVAPSPARTVAPAMPAVH
jgi:Fur family ferric uptake transcriptional regulator